MKPKITIKDIEESREKLRIATKNKVLPALSRSPHSIIQTINMTPICSVSKDLTPHKTSAPSIKTDNNNCYSTIDVVSTS